MRLMDFVFEMLSSISQQEYLTVHWKNSNLFHQLFQSVKQSFSCESRDTELEMLDEHVM